MPRDTEADRIARERRAQQQAQAKKQQAEAERQEEAQRELDLHAISDETSRILSLLAKLGYPDMTEREFVETEVRRSFFGGRVTLYYHPLRIKAAWVIGEHPYTIRDREGYSTRTENLYLLSDGYIGLDGMAISPETLREYAHDDGSVRLFVNASVCLPDIVLGLRQLRQRLEAM